MKKLEKPYSVLSLYVIVVAIVLFVSSLVFIPVTGFYPGIIVFLGTAILLFLSRKYMSKRNQADPQQQKSILMLLLFFNLLVLLLLVFMTFVILVDRVFPKVL